MRWHSVGLSFLLVLGVGQPGARADAYTEPRSLAGAAPGRGALRSAGVLVDLDALLPSSPNTGLAARALSQPQPLDSSPPPRLEGSLSRALSQSLRPARPTWPANTVLAEQLAVAEQQALPLPLPEPASLLLVGTGVLGLWARRRMRKSRQGQGEDDDDC